MKSKYKFIRLGCLGMVIFCMAMIAYIFLTVDDYCNDEFFDFLDTEDVIIKILKCTEGQVLYPKIIKVADVKGSPTQIKKFLFKNGFYKTQNYEGRLGYDVYKPYSDSINKNDLKYFYDNDSMGLYMLYSNHLLFIEFPGSTTFQD